MSVRICECAYEHNNDVRLDRENGQKLSEMLDVCVGRAINALSNPIGNYNELQCNTMIEKFHGMRDTFKHVQVILGAGAKKPYSVDALTISRLTLEDLYTLCLMFESPDYVMQYLRNGWRKNYIDFLLQAKETKNLPRFDEYNKNIAIINLEHLRQLFGITVEQKLSINKDELDMPLPASMAYASIPKFPTPSGIIKIMKKTSSPEKYAMLARLYFEYSFLSSYTHGLPDAILYKNFFSNRPTAARVLFSEDQLKSMWDRTVSERSFLISLLSVIQAVAELTLLYPTDAELAGSVMEIWQIMLDGFLLGQAIWNIRTKNILRLIK